MGERKNLEAAAAEPEDDPGPDARAFNAGIHIAPAMHVVLKLEEAHAEGRSHQQVKPTADGHRKPAPRIGICIGWQGQRYRLRYEVKVSPLITEKGLCEGAPDTDCL